MFFVCSILRPTCWWQKCGGYLRRLRSLAYGTEFTREKMLGMVSYPCGL